MVSSCQYDRLRIACALAVIFIVTSGLTNVHADDVNIRGLWYSNVTIQKFANGKIYFQTTAGNVVAQDLRDTRSLKVKQLPGLQKAEESYEDRQYKAAIKNYKAIRPKATGGAGAKWLGQWIDSRLVKCAEQTADVQTALTAYLSLAKSDADAYLLRHRPDRSLEKLTKALQQQFLKKIKVAITKSRNRTTRNNLKLLQKVRFEGKRIACHQLAIRNLRPKVLSNGVPKLLWAN